MHANFSQPIMIMFFPGLEEEEELQTSAAGKFAKSEVWVGVNLTLSDSRETIINLDDHVNINLHMMDKWQDLQKGKYLEVCNSPSNPTSFIVFLRFWKSLKSGASTCSASRSWRTRRRWRAWRTQSSRSATSSRRSRSQPRSSSTFFAHSKTTTCRWTHWTQC